MIVMDIIMEVTNTLEQIVFQKDPCPLFFESIWLCKNL